MIYVFDGELTLRLNERTATARKGSLVYVPSGTMYSVRVDSERAHCLDLHTRSGFEELVRFEGEGLHRTQYGARARLLEQIGLVELGIDIFSEE